MKKILSIFLLQLFVFGVVFGATIDSKKGYEKLAWGSGVEEAKKAGYKLTRMTANSEKEYLAKLYADEVDAYKVTSKDKTVSSVQFHFYKGKLFAVSEVLNITNADQKKLANRYGNFSERGITQVGKQYIDIKFAQDGTVSSLSIIISPSANSVSTIMCDWNVYKDISFAGRSLIGQKEKSIVDELAPLANKLVQEKSGGSKASFAFVALTTDYKNTLVDNYITDALSEAMFNTGKIKIIERGNLEAILSEQKFQASGLVNEQTAKDIGMIAGVDFVCYGTLKDIGDSFTVNARVVDVETGEIAAMSRTNVTKDAYLKEQPQKAVGTSLYNSATAAKIQTVGTAEAATQPGTAPVANNAWKVVKYNDEFGGFTQYVFTVNSTDERMLFVSYKKCDNAANDRVIAGIHWENNDHYWLRSSYDIKGQEGSTVTKNLGDAWKMYLDSSEKSHFYFVWNQKAGARWLVDIIRKSDSVAVRRDGLTRRFQTAGLMDKMAEYGITWAEIDAALANEEF